MTEAKSSDMELKKLSYEQIKQIVGKYFPNKVKEIYNPCTESYYLIENGKIVETIKKKEQENRKLLNTQIKKRIKEFEKTPISEKLNTMRKELDLTDFKIAHINKTMKVLSQQKEDLLKWREEVKKMIENKDFERFKKENYRLI